MIKTIKSKINKIIEGIQNIIRWVPVIYQDRDWDYDFIYVLLYHKLKNMQEFFESDKVWSTKSDRVAKQIMISKNLCKRLSDQQYLTNALTNYHNKYGEDSTVWHSEPTENPKLHRLVWDWSEQQHKDFTKASNHSDYMEQQDLDYLFKYLRKYIQGWWD